MFFSLLVVLVLTVSSRRFVQAISGWNSPTKGLDMLVITPYLEPALMANVTFFSLLLVLIDGSDGLSKVVRSS